MDPLPGLPERTPRGHDLDALRDSLSLTPAERIRRNSEWVRVAEALREGLRRVDGSGEDLPDAP